MIRKNLPRIHVFNLPKSRRQSLLGIPVIAKIICQDLRRKKRWRCDQWDCDLEISSYVMDMLWICYGYSNRYVFLTSLPFAFWEIRKKKKNICQAPGVVSCIVQDLVQFHLDIPNSHRLQASPEPIAMWVNRPWFGAYVSNIWVVEMGVPRVLIDFRLASSMK